MNHSEYIRVSEDNKTAILMIHGIAGTPDHFRDLVPLIPEGWSVYNILLEGHGKEVRDFGAASMKKWKAQVAARLEEIREKHDRIIIVTHSMGGLFAIQEAISDPEKIVQLFLLVLPLRAFVRPVTVVSSLKIVLGRVKESDSVVDRTARMMREDCSIRLNRRFWEYIFWLPRMIELLWEIRKTRNMLHELAVPCETYQSARDELVSMKTCKYLENHPYIKNTVLENSGHFGYEGEERERLIERFREMVERLN